jgi:site-specific DNA-methyltransferase (adenine-specific)
MAFKSITQPKATRILDTHLGSGSIAVACDVMNFELVGCEIDEQYYLKAQKRYENERCQTKLF